MSETPNNKINDLIWNKIEDFDLDSTEARQIYTKFKYEKDAFKKLSSDNLTMLELSLNMIWDLNDYDAMLEALRQKAWITNDAIPIEKSEPEKELKEKKISWGGSKPKDITETKATDSFDVKDFMKQVPKSERNKDYSGMLSAFRKEAKKFNTMIDDCINNPAYFWTAISESDRTDLLSTYFKSIIEPWTNVKNKNGVALDWYYTFKKVSQGEDSSREVDKFVMYKWASELLMQRLLSDKVIKAKEGDNWLDAQKAKTLLSITQDAALMRLIDNKYGTYGKLNNPVKKVERSWFGWAILNFPLIKLFFDPTKTVEIDNPDERMALWKSPISENTKFRVIWELVKNWKTIEEIKKILKLNEKIERHSREEDSMYLNAQDVFLQLAIEFWFASRDEHIIKWKIEHDKISQKTRVWLRWKGNYDIILPYDEVTINTTEHVESQVDAEIHTEVIINSNTTWEGASWGSLVAWLWVFSALWESGYTITSIWWLIYMCDEDGRYTLMNDVVFEQADAQIVVNSFAEGVMTVTVTTETETIIKKYHVVKKDTSANAKVSHTTYNQIDEKTLESFTMWAHHNWSSHETNYNLDYSVLKKINDWLGLKGSAKTDFEEVKGALTVILWKSETTRIIMDTDWRTRLSQKIIQKKIWNKQLNINLSAALLSSFEDSIKNGRLWIALNEAWFTKQRCK